MTDPNYVVDGILTDGDSLVPIEATSLAGVSGLQWDTGTGTKNWSQYEDLLIIATNKNTTNNAMTLAFNGLGGSNYTQYQYIMGNGTTVSAGDAVATYGYLHWGQAPGPSGAVARISGINSQSFTKCISQLMDTRGSSAGWSGLYATTFLYYWGIHRIDLDFGGGTGSTGSKAWLYGILPRMGLVS